MVYHSDNLILTHVIKTKIEAEDIKDDENLKCKFCQNKAQIHCENCQVYFCKTCDDLVHGGDEVEAHDEKGRIMN